MVEYQFKVSPMNPKGSEVDSVVVVELRGDKQLADKLKKFIEDNAEPEEWEVY